MSIGHNNPPDGAPTGEPLTIEQTVSRLCRMVELAAVAFWLAYVVATAT